MDACLPTGDQSQLEDCWKDSVDAPPAVAHFILMFCHAQCIQTNKDVGMLSVSWIFTEAKAQVSLLK
jgi:hypothetical protein